jgi:hypothetical protein
MYRYKYMHVVSLDFASGSKRKISGANVGDNVHIISVPLGPMEGET